jgi:phage-related protein
MAKAAIGAVPGILESILGENTMSVLTAVSPVIAGIAAAVTTYKVAVTAANVVEGIRNGLIAFSAVMTGTQAAAFAPLTTATIAQIAATNALNIVTGALGATMKFFTSGIGIVSLIVCIVAAFVYCWNRFEGFRNFWISAWDVIKNGASAAWGGIKAVFSAISTVVSTVFGAMKATVTQKLGNIKNAYTSHGGGVKGVVFAYMEGVKSFYTAGLTFVDNLTGGKLTAIKDKFISGFNTVKESVVNAFASIRDKIKGIWDNIKSFFKMPSIEVVGTVTIAGFDTPIPKLGVKWNAQGGIMTRPTIFGVNGNNFLGGGEKGAEAILPLSVLWDKLERFLAPQRAAVPVRANNNVINVNVYSNNEDDATLADKVAEKILEILDNM